MDKVMKRNFGFVMLILLLQFSAPLWVYQDALAAGSVRVGFAVNANADWLRDQVKEFVSSELKKRYDLELVESGVSAVYIGIVAGIVPDTNKVAISSVIHDSKGTMKQNMVIGVQSNVRSICNDLLPNLDSLLQNYVPRR